MKKYSSRAETVRNNKIRIAKFISVSGSTSKADIAAGVGISMPTTLQYVKELTDAGIVTEEGEYESTGGRRAKALSIKRNAGYAVGVDITNNHINFVIIDARKDILASERIRKEYKNETQYYDFLLNAESEFAQGQKIDQKKIVGIGFSLPGIVDKERKLLLRSHALKVQNVSFRTVGDALGNSYEIENDANSAAFAEIGNSVGNAVYLSLSNTVGGAICMEHQMYEGENFKSAEFGHMVIEKGGRQCYCGKRGCLDAYCSAKLLQTSKGESLEGFFQKVRMGDSEARLIWEKYLDYLAIAVTNLRMIFDCRIVLGGYAGGYIKEFMPELTQRIMEYNNFDVDTSYLHAGRYKYNASAYGAALRFIDSIFENI